MEKKLRIGILVEGDYIDAWSYKMIESIQRSEHSEMVLIIKKELTPIKVKSPLRQIWDNKNDIARILFNKLEDKIFNVNPDAFAKKNIKELGNISEIIVSLKETELDDYILPIDIEKIDSYEIDVLIKLGFGTLKGDILTVAKYGVWSLYHGDIMTINGDFHGVWEVLEEWDETGASLLILSEDFSGSILLTSSISATDKVSVKRNKNNYYWKSISMIPRKLKELHQKGGDAFFEDLKNSNHINFYSNRRFEKPTNLQVLKAFVRIYSTKIFDSIYRKFYFNQWILLYKFEKTNSWSKSFTNFKRLVPPKDRFWADPFIYENEGTYFLFIEELLYNEKKGKISVMELREDGQFTPPITVLEKDNHLSYPFLYEHENCLYMLPETSASKTIEIYKCVEFPFKWELTEVLMDNIYAVDSTILNHNNKFWLFCNVVENEGASSLDELFLYFSDNLLGGKWTAHPLNPIVSDVNRARPAGRVFKQNNRLYRPSQNSSKRYGYGMKINEIVELTESTYKEVVIQSINPTWEKDVLGTHTINNCKKLTVIDAMISRRK